MDKSTKVLTGFQRQPTNHRPQLRWQFPIQSSPQPRPPRPGDEPEKSRKPVSHTLTAVSVARFGLRRYLHAHTHQVPAAHAIAIPSAGHFGSRGGRGQEDTVASLSLENVTASNANGR